jgi:hypothetical protein
MAEGMLAYEQNCAVARQLVGWLLRSLNKCGPVRVLVWTANVLVQFTDSRPCLISTPLLQSE